MGFVQYFVALLVLSAQLVLSSPLTKRTTDGKGCNYCPAGTYQKSCTKCEPCSPGRYTKDRNTEDSCHDCYGDCSPEHNLEVVRNCTSTSNLKCVCKNGYICSLYTPDKENCRECAEITTTTNTATPGPCQSTKSCPPTPTKPGPTSAHLAAILSPVILLVFVALVLLFCVLRPGDETYLRQTLAKLWNEEGRGASHKSKEPSHQVPRDSFSTKQPSSSPSAANLGPVHVHNPGTVIFSLLSHFTGHVGPTAESGKTAESARREEEDERDCSVFHPASSPSIHLSEEERSGENDTIFFPSQEQGKDYHVSKEEVL